MKSLPELIVETPRSAWSGGVVFGLGDAVEEARVLDRPLSAWRGAGARQVGSGEALVGPALVVGRDLWVSPRLVEVFGRVAASVGGGEPVRLRRAADGPAALADPLGRLPREGGEILFDLWYLPAGCRVEAGPGVELPAALEAARGVDVPARTQTISGAVDSGAPGGEAGMSVVLSDVAAAPVGHWVEVLRANLLALGTRVLEHGPLVAVFVLLWAAVRALSLNPFRILQKLTRRGRRCWVHPDAVVEGCLLGDDVKIDAGAVLRGCVLGDGAKVGPGVVAEYTVIGQGAELQKQSTAVLSVVYPEARLGGVLQLGLAGRGARLKMGAYCTDMNLQGPVRVLTPEGLRPVDMGYQGVCLGHGAFVASGVWIAPGRVIEAGRVVLRPEGSMVLK